MSKFTKGPWVIGPYDPRLVFGNDGGLVAKTCRGDAQEDIKNALLIAAAPQMYEALQAVVSWRGLDGDGISDPVLGQVESALDAAKAGK